MVKTLILLLAFPFYVNSEALSQDTDRYKSFFGSVRPSLLSSGNWVSVRSVMEDLSWSGIRDETLFDQIASELKGSYLETDGPTVERASWLAKALALSGNVKYRELLEEIRDSSAHKKVKKHVEIAIGRLSNYESWAPIIGANLDSAKTAEELDAMRIKNMIEAEDLILVRMGVKRAYYDFRNEERFLDNIQFKLASYHNQKLKTKEEIDAVVWMVRVLKESKLTKYVPALKTVYQSGYPRKVRKEAACSNGIGCVKYTDSIRDQ